MQKHEGFKINVEIFIFALKLYFAKNLNKNKSNIFLSNDKIFFSFIHECIEDYGHF